MPQVDLQIVSINNSNIAPWGNVSNTYRSRDFNSIRRSMRQAIMFPHLRENHVNNGITTRIHEQISELRNFFPPIRRTFDRVWRDHILPDTEVFLSTNFLAMSASEAADELYTSIKFERYCGNLRSREDVAVYKYCVIIAAINIAREIFGSFAGSCRFYPVSYIDITRESTNAPFIYCMPSGTWALQLPYSSFLELYCNIGYSSNEGHFDTSYYFWTTIMSIYNNARVSLRGRQLVDAPIRRRSVPDELRGSNSLGGLMKEYSEREKEDCAFISRDHIIEMIDKSFFSEKFLIVLDDIITRNLHKRRNKK